MAEEAEAACSVDGVAPGAETDVVEGEGEAVPSETEESGFLQSSIERKFQEMLGGRGCNGRRTRCSSFGVSQRIVVVLTQFI